VATPSHDAKQRPPDYPTAYRGLRTSPLPYRSLLSTHCSPRTAQGKNMLMTDMAEFIGQNVQQVLAKARHRFPGRHVLLLGMGSAGCPLHEKDARPVHTGARERRRCPRCAMSVTARDLNDIYRRLVQQGGGQDGLLTFIEPPPYGPGMWDDGLHVNREGCDLLVARIESSLRQVLDRPYL